MHAQLPQMFDATQIAPDTGAAGQLPVGEHLVQITGSAIKTTQAGDGGLVQFELVVIDGPHTGATGAYRLNLFNPSEAAARIARAQLSALCHVTGRFQVSDLSVLSGIPFRVKVQMQKDSDKYTEVVKLMDANGNAPGAKGGGQPAAQQGPGPGPQAGQPMQQQQQQQQQPQQQPQQQQPAQGGGWGAPQGGQAQQPAQQPAQPQQGGNAGWGGPQQGQPQQGQQWQQGNAGAAPWGGGQG